MTTTRRTFVEPRTVAPDDAGWRFMAAPETGDEPAPSPRKKLPSLSWRLRH